jgi:hypothetical protein
MDLGNPDPGGKKSVGVRGGVADACRPTLDADNNT